MNCLFNNFVSFRKKSIRYFVHLPENLFGSLHSTNYSFDRLSFGKVFVHGSELNVQTERLRIRVSHNKSITQMLQNYLATVSNVQMAYT